MKPIFISGIGTGVGKTIISAIVAEALQADYWKPIQAGFEDGTDALNVQHLLSNPKSIVHPELYKLETPASPHIAARHQNISISLEEIRHAYLQLASVNPYIIIEGAGGLLVPLNQQEFIIDLVEKLDAVLILVSKNYLGSINHSLLTSCMCRQRNLNVLGWIFNDQYLDYEREIVDWSGYSLIGSVPLLPIIDKEHIAQQALRLREALKIQLYL